MRLDFSPELAWERCPAFTDMGPVIPRDGRIGLLGDAAIADTQPWVRIPALDPSVGHHRGSAHRKFRQAQCVSPFAAYLLGRDDVERWSETDVAQLPRLFRVVPHEDQDWASCETRGIHLPCPILDEHDDRDDERDGGDDEADGHGRVRCIDVLEPMHCCAGLG